METFSTEINVRLSQEMDSVMSMMHAKINKAISHTISDRVFAEIQNIMGSLSSGHKYTKSGPSNNNQDSNVATSGFETKITKKDSRSAFD